MSFSGRRIVMVLSLIGLLSIACGSGGEKAATFAQVQPDEIVRDISNFDGSGFKQVREYDVTGLPGALGAYLGYYTPPESDPIQYELRFYPDHATAVANGVDYADEVTGEGAALRSADVRWDEGTKDRRGGGGFRDTLTPLYADYVVFGNLFLLCEGRDSSQSFSRCNSLLEAAGIIPGS